MLHKFCNAANSLQAVPLYDPATPIPRRVCEAERVLDLKADRWAKFWNNPAQIGSTTIMFQFLRHICKLKVKEEPHNNDLIAEYDCDTLRNNAKHYKKVANSLQLPVLRKTRTRAI